MSVQAVNEAKYEELIRSGATVLLDFYADWCGPCRMLSPVIEQIADEHPEIVVGKVNVDQENALAMRFGIVSIPFVALIKNGEVVARSLGYRQKDELLSVLEL